MKAAHNKTEADWAAEWDAQTLAKAEIIKADPARLKAATKAANDLVAKEKAEAKAMEKVANA